MTKEKKYIYNLINELLDKFPNLGIKYEFKEKSNTHLIQISPDNIFEQADFNSYHIAIIQEFYSKFSDSCIALITSDSLVTVENPEIEYKPFLQKSRIVNISPNENVFNDYSLYNYFTLEKSAIDWASIFIGEQSTYHSTTLKTDCLQTLDSSEMTTYVATNIGKFDDWGVYPILESYAEKGLIKKMFSKTKERELIPQYEDLAKAA